MMHKRGKGACFVTNTPKRNTLEVVSSITEQPTNISVLTTGPDKLRDPFKTFKKFEVEKYNLCCMIPQQIHSCQRYSWAPICPTFQAPAASSRPLSNALMSERWPRVPPSVTFKPLFKSCFLDSPFALPSAAAARRRVVGRRGHCLPVSGYTTQACCCDNNSPLSPVLFYPTNPNPPLSLSLSCLFLLPGRADQQTRFG